MTKIAEVASVLENQKLDRELDKRICCQGAKNANEVTYTSEVDRGTGKKIKSRLLATDWVKVNRNRDSEKTGCWNSNIIETYDTISTVS